MNFIAALNVVRFIGKALITNGCSSLLLGYLTLNSWFELFIDGGDRSFKIS